MATKIKLEIESDETILSAKLLLRNADGTTSVEDMETTTEKPLAIKKSIEAGVDPDMVSKW